MHTKIPNSPPPVFDVEREVPNSPPDFEFDERVSTLARKPSPEVGTWQPVDMSLVLSADYDPPKPEVGFVPDGGGLFYSGRTNMLFGDSGGGKTWTMMWAAVEEMRSGNDVLYLDYEDTAAALAARLLAVGATVEMVQSRFIYIKPEEKWGRSASAQLDAALAGRNVALAVIDSVGEAMASDGVINSNSDDEVTRWFRGLPKYLAEAGPAVVLLDHVPKGSGDAARNTNFSIGSQRKRAAINGVSYFLSVIAAPSRDKAGKFKLTVRKDRHGFRAAGTVACVVDMVPSDGGETVALSAHVPSDEDRAAPPSGTVRRTWYMERVSECLEDAGKPLSKNAVRAVIGRKRDYVYGAIDTLEAEGHVRVEKVGQSHLCHLLKPYREVGDSAAVDTSDDDGEYF